MDEERVPEPRAWRPFPLFFDNPRVSMDVWRRCLDFTPTPTVRGWLRELLCVVAFAWAWWSVMVFIRHSAAQHGMEVPEAWVGPVQALIDWVPALPLFACLVRRCRSLQWYRIGMWTFILLALTVAVAIATPPDIRLHSIFVFWWLFALLLARPYGTEWWEYDVPIDWSAYGAKLEAMRGVEWEWRYGKPPRQ